MTFDNSFSIIDDQPAKDDNVYLCNICHYPLSKDGECARCNKTYITDFNPQQQPSKIDVKGSKPLLTSNTNRQFGNSDFIGAVIEDDKPQISKEKKTDKYVKYLEDMGYNIKEVREK